MSELQPDHELQALAKALQSLSPNPGNLDRDRLMFDAGRLSARPSRLWPGAALVSGGLAAVLAFVIVLRPSATPIIRFIEVPVAKSDEETKRGSAIEESVPPSSAPIEHRESYGTHSHARLQDHVLRWGLDMPALSPIPDQLGEPAIALRIERGSPRTAGLFTSWLFSREAN